MEPKNPNLNNSSNPENIPGKNTQPAQSRTVRNGRGFDVPLDLLEKHMDQYKKENPDSDQDDLNDEKNDFIEYYEDPSQMERIGIELRERSEKARQRALKNENPTSRESKSNESSSGEINTDGSNETFSPQNKEKEQKTQTTSSDISDKVQTLTPDEEPVSSSKEEFIDDPEYAQQLMMLKMGKITQKDLNEYRDLYGSSKPDGKKDNNNEGTKKEKIKDFSGIPDQKMVEKPNKLENIKDFDGPTLNKKEQKNVNLSPRLNSTMSPDFLLDYRLDKEEILSSRNQKIPQPEIIRPEILKGELMSSFPSQTTLSGDSKSSNPVLESVKNEINNISNINNEIGGNKFEEKNFLSETRLNQSSENTLLSNTQNSYKDFTTKLITNIQDLSSKPNLFSETNNTTNNSEIKTGELKNETLFSNIPNMENILAPTSLQNMFSDQKTENTNYMSSLSSTINEIVGSKSQQLSTDKTGLTNISPSLTNMGGSPESFQNSINNFQDLSNKLSIFSNLNSLSPLEKITNPETIDSPIIEKISNISNLYNSSVLNTANNPYNKTNSSGNFSQNNNLKSTTNSSIFPNNFFNISGSIPSMVPILEMTNRPDLSIPEMVNRQNLVLSDIINSPNLPISDNQKNRLPDINTINPFTSEIIRLNKIKESTIKTNESVEKENFNSKKSFLTNEVNTNRVETKPLAMIEKNTAVQTPQLMREQINSDVIATKNNSTEQTSSEGLSSDPKIKELPITSQQSNMPNSDDNKSEEPNTSNQILGGLSAQLATLTSVVREISTKLSYLDEDTNLSFK